MALHYVYQPLISGINGPLSLSEALTETSEVSNFRLPVIWKISKQSPRSKGRQVLWSFLKHIPFYEFEISTVNSTFSRCPLGHSSQSKDWNPKPAHQCCSWKDRFRSVGKKRFCCIHIFQSSNDLQRAGKGRKRRAEIMKKVIIIMKRGL